MHRERSNAPYPKAFKIEAVRLYRESSKSRKEVTPAKRGWQGKVFPPEAQVLAFAAMETKQTGSGNCNYYAAVLHR